MSARVDYDKMGERFLNDTAKHVMQVLHDDGVYRHIRFGESDSNHYAYYLATFPGFMVVSGDMGNYTFWRTEDMMGFFNQKHINPSYWGEKLEAHGRNDFEEYSTEILEEHVKEYFDSFSYDLLGDDEDFIDTTESGKEERAYMKQLLMQLWESITWKVLGAENEYEAHKALSEYEFNDYEKGTVGSDYARQRIINFTFNDAWEWHLTTYTHRYIWICHAIRTGVEQYLASQTNNEVKE